MNLKYSSYVIPALGTLCAVGAVSVGVIVRTPTAHEKSFGDELAYEANVPENLEFNSNIPTMEDVVEKHLFVKERKATGANTFPDLLVKGVYVGDEEGSVILSLQSRPTINLRIWESDVGDVIGRITDPRDPRQAIVNFLNEWDIREITFDGMVVENFITGEVETYAVNYVPTKKAKDNSESGYGQGLLAATTVITAPKVTPAKAATQPSMDDRRKMMENFRGMVEQMSPEQRARLAQRISGDQSGGGSGRPSDSRSNGGSSTRSSGGGSGSSGGSRGGGGR